MTPATATERGGGTEAKTALETIGLVDAGLLGSAMAERLRAHSFRVNGLDPNASRREALTALGAQAAGISPSRRGPSSSGTPKRSDYSGIISDRRVGVTLMTDPANFRPSWFHNRDYGLMVANPFGLSSMKQGEVSRVEVNQGEKLRLRFGLLLHSAAPDKDTDLAAAYRDFLGQLPKPSP